MKSLQLGADLLCQKKDVHLQQISRDKWFNYMKTGNQRAAIVKEYELAHLSWIAGLNKRTPRVPLLKRITERQKKMNLLRFAKNLSSFEWRMTF